MTPRRPGHSGTSFGLFKSSVPSMTMRYFFLSLSREVDPFAYGLNFDAEAKLISLVA